MDRALGQFWPRARSKLYEEPKKLVTHGLAIATRESTGRRPRTVYSITSTGPAGARPVGADASRAARPHPRVRTPHQGLLCRAWNEDRPSAHAGQSPRLGRHAGRARCPHLFGTISRGRGPFPERLAWNILVGRFLDDFDTLVDQWAEWATEVVEQWPDDLREAMPDVVTLRAMFDRNIAVGQHRVTTHDSRNFDESRPFARRRSRQADVGRRPSDGSAPRLAVAASCARVEANDGIHTRSPRSLPREPVAAGHRSGHADVGLAGVGSKCESAESPTRRSPWPASTAIRPGSSSLLTPMGGGVRRQRRRHGLQPGGGARPHLQGRVDHPTIASRYPRSSRRLPPGRGRSRRPRALGPPACPSVGGMLCAWQPEDVTDAERDRLVTFLRSKQCGSCRRGDATAEHPACVEAEELITIVELGCEPAALGFDSENPIVRSRCTSRSATRSSRRDAVYHKVV